MNFYMSQCPYKILIFILVYYSSDFYFPLIHLFIYPKLYNIGGILHNVAWLFFTCAMNKITINSIVQEFWDDTKSL